MAASFASAPVLQKNARSAKELLTRRFASSTCGSAGGCFGVRTRVAQLQVRPCFCACPLNLGPQEIGGMRRHEASQ
eukprot:scaffold211726_cov16-Tisochrysis_lutea.AAC.2